MRRYIDIIRLNEGVSQQDIDGALAILDRDRASYSIDSYYAQMDIDEDDVMNELEGEIFNAEARVRRGIRDGVITLYREIIAPKDWDHTVETRPHEYWGFDPATAHAHWGDESDDMVRWLITAHAPESAISWPDTLARNANPALEQENEVILRTGTTPVIASAVPREASFQNRHF
jgi:hypothetical protein